jgi:DUF971 family protein
MDPVPERVAVAAHGRALRVRWRDGLEAALSASALRDACRCASCTHLRRCGEPVQSDPGIGLLQVAEFGVAGLQLVFSDGHRRGLFPWEYLRQLATHSMRALPAEERPVQLPDPGGRGPAASISPDENGRCG